ncbi:MAG TPA: UDP-N-acetylmuramoyl-L-alanyl-D-glutamate--2,6-diaminopimelate ligase [Gemmatimonadaceae bacterium]|nr:UDP-N-acetylmuramoyl-L-alanyl-D-glutamate--2,6-diaminopimelate ligase [Gemmatimonadaceae bacterium]
MTVDVGAIADALRQAGLLVKTPGRLPDAATGITDDSRAVTPGSMFVAVRGSAADGHGFLAAAADAGAALAIVEDASLTKLPSLVVSDSRAAAAVAAGAAYGHPAKSLRLIGVTGTNGKTTTTALLRALLHEKSAPAASIGTLGVLVGAQGEPSPGGAGLTTPGPVELQRVLRVLVDAGVRTVAMEVSSHSLDQGRVTGLSFAAAVFTNLTRDHLDYHGTMEAYFAAKAKLISYLSPDGVAFINAGEAAWANLPAAPGKFVFGKGGELEVSPAVRYTLAGADFELTYAGKSQKVRLPLIGDFNVENAAAAAAVALQVGVPLPMVASRLSTAPQVPGRLEKLARGPTIIRDYAHTPDALERVLKALKPMCAGRLVVVFGCGGDRDKGKRPLMGAIASKLADVAIVTSDNPRTENPEQIINDVVAGMPAGKYERIEDRRAAIERAIEVAQSSDVVVIAGKGHETYQIRGTTHYPFDEKVIVGEILGASR